MAGGELAKEALRAIDDYAGRRYEYVNRRNG
jgi:hypothetical protein